MASAAAWDRCTEAIAGLRVPSPFTLEAFIAELSAQRGTAIELIPIRHVPGSPCGTLISTEDTEYIYYATNTSSLHADHIALHEVGHLVLDHRGTTAVTEEVARRLMPTLSPELLRRVLGRTAYSSAEEQEAELFATMVLERAARAAPEPEPDPRLRRFTEILGP
ncbi:hypothetical protein [Kutzneria albida]|uniref:IrrE N-terminal-like domain-containing protein n=1 Tax=Kutzneria albida DSM 43870 TaxID=1449976 RepID=W5VYW3_9PSEU|nr:hypothetical protein [Kutzneria albida]AHH93752.1 hypothetical protein KALB_375 [Kutzneria albida DSM 43870]